MEESLLAHLKGFYTNHIYAIASLCPRPFLVSIFLVVAVPLSTLLLSLQTTHTTISLDSNLEFLQHVDIDSIAPKITTFSFIFNLILLCILILSIIATPSMKTTANMPSSPKSSKNDILFNASNNCLSSKLFLPIMLLHPAFSACMKLYSFLISSPSIYFSTREAFSSPYGFLNILLTFALGYLCMDCDYDYTVKSKDGLSRGFKMTSMIAYSARCCGILILAITPKMEFPITIIVSIVECIGIINTPFHSSTIQTTAISSNIYVASVSIAFLIIESQSHTQSAVLFACILIPFSYGIAWIVQNIISTRILTTPIQHASLEDLDACMRMRVFSLAETSKSFDYMSALQFINVSLTGIVDQSKRSGTSSSNSGGSKHQANFTIPTRHFIEQQSHLDILELADIRSPIFIEQIRETFKKIIKYRFEYLNRLSDHLAIQSRQNKHRAFTPADPRFLVFLLQVYKSPRLYWLLYENSCKRTSSLKYSQILNSTHSRLFEAMTTSHVIPTTTTTSQNNNKPSLATHHTNAKTPRTSPFDRIYVNLITFEDRVTQIYADFHSILQQKLQVFELMRQRTINSLDFIIRIESFIKQREHLRKSISKLISIASTPLSNQILRFFEQEILLQRDILVRSTRKTTSAASKAKTTKDMLTGNSILPPNQVITEKSCVILTELQADRSLLILKLSHNAANIFTTTSNLKGKQIESLMPAFEQKHHQTFIDDYLSARFSDQSKLQDLIVFASTQTSIYVKPVRVDVRVNAFLNTFGIAALITPVYSHHRQSEQINSLSAPSYIIFDRIQRSVVGISKRIHRYIFAATENPVKIDLPTHVPQLKETEFTGTFSHLIVTLQPNQQLKPAALKKQQTYAKTFESKTTHTHSLLTRIQSKRSVVSQFTYGGAGATSQDRSPVQIDEQFQFTYATITIAQFKSRSFTNIATLEFPQMSRLSFQKDALKIVGILREQNQQSQRILLAELETILSLYSSQSFLNTNMQQSLRFKPDEQLLLQLQFQRRHRSSGDDDNDNSSLNSVDQRNIIEENEQSNELLEDEIDDNDEEEEEEDEIDNNQLKNAIINAKNQQEKSAGDSNMQFPFLQNRESLILNSPRSFQVLTPNASASANVLQQQQLPFSIRGINESSQKIFTPDSPNGTSSIQLNYLLPMQSPSSGQDLMFSPVSMQQLLIHPQNELTSNRNVIFDSGAMSMNMNGNNHQNNQTSAVSQMMMVKSLPEEQLISIELKEDRFQMQQRKDSSLMGIGNNKSQQQMYDTNHNNHTNTEKSSSPMRRNKKLRLDQSLQTKKDTSVVFSTTQARVSSQKSLQTQMFTSQKSVKLPKRRDQLLFNNTNSHAKNHEINANNISASNDLQPLQFRKGSKRQHTKEETNSAKKRSSIASAERELKFLMSSKYYTRSEVKILGLIGTILISALIGIIVLEFNNLISSMQLRLTSQQVGSWPADYISSTNSIIKANNILLWLKFDAFPHSDELKAHISANSVMLRDNAIQYINQAVNSDSEILLFQLVRDKKSEFLFGEYYDVSRLSSVSSVPAKYIFYSIEYNTSLLFSTVLSYQHIYRYSKGLGVDRPEYYMILNNLHFIDSFDELQKDIIVSQSEQDEQKKDRLIAVTVIFIAVSAVLVFAMIPLEIYKQQQKETILALFATFSAEKVDEFVEDVTRAQDTYYEMKGESNNLTNSQAANQKFKEGTVTTSMLTSHMYKRGTRGTVSSNVNSKNFHSVTTRLDKIHFIFAMKLLLIFAIIIIYPIVNHIVSTAYVNYSFVCLRTLVNMYKVKGYIVELVALSITNIVVNLHPTSKPVLVTQYMPTIKLLLGQKDEMEGQIKNLILEQGVVSRYQEEMYDDFFFEVLKSDMCAVFERYPEQVSNTTIINQANCTTLRGGFLRKGFQLAFKEYLTVFQQMYSIASMTPTSTEFQASATEFLSTFDLYDFTFFQEFLAEVLVSLKDFILETSQSYHNTMLLWQRILLVLQIILLILVFIMGFLSYVRNVFFEIDRTKRYLSIIDFHSLQQNTYILSYIQRTRQSHQ